MFEGWKCPSQIFVGTDSPRARLALSFRTVARGVVTIHRAVPVVTVAHRSGETELRRYLWISRFDASIALSARQVNRMASPTYRLYGCG